MFGASKSCPFSGVILLNPFIKQFPLVGTLFLHFVEAKEDL